MIFKNINSEDISGLIICSEPPISSSAIRTKETTIDGRDGAIVEKLGYKTRIRNVEIGLKKDANVDKILSYFSGEGDLIFKNENDKVYKAAIYEQVDLERLLRLRKGSVAFYCQPFKYKRNDIFETIKDNKVKEKKGKHLELLNCAEQNVVDLKLEGSTNQATRSGKNLLDIKNENMQTSHCTKEYNGNSLTLTSAKTAIPAKTTIPVDYPLNKALTISFDATFLEGYDLNSDSVIYFRSGSTNIGRIVLTKDNQKHSYSITIPNGIAEEGYTFWLYIKQSPIEGVVSIKFDNIQIEQGTTATEYEPYGVMPSPDYPSEIENIEGNIEVKVTNGLEETDENYQEQVVTFPLSEGQKLMEGSYLADDGIHHKRKQYTFTGNETVNITTYGNNKRFTVVPSSYNPSYKGQDMVGLCNYLKRDYMGTVGNANLAQEPCFFIHPSGILITMTPDTNIVNETQLKTWLATKHTNGTPVIVEYELAEEETVPYTAEQQEAYNQLQKLKLYKGQNTMFSLEGSIINLKYLEDTDEKVENQGNIYSKPIIRLEKTVFKEVEIAINGIRFKYNFEEDDYVEIDCEEMTVQYEGLDRNRRLVIDFEFPKLKEGNNDIVMYSGDCIIKCKRKDRWL